MSELIGEVRSAVALLQEKPTKGNFQKLIKLLADVEVKDPYFQQIVPYIVQTVKRLPDYCRRIKYSSRTMSLFARSLVLGMNYKHYLALAKAYKELKLEPAYFMGAIKYVFMYSTILTTQKIENDNRFERGDWAITHRTEMMYTYREIKQYRGEERFNTAYKFYTIDPDQHRRFFERYLRYYGLHQDEFDAPTFVWSFLQLFCPYDDARRVNRRPFENYSLREWLLSGTHHQATKFPDVYFEVGTDVEAFHSNGHIIDLREIVEKDLGKGDITNLIPKMAAGDKVAIDSMERLKTLGRGATTHENNPLFAHVRQRESQCRVARNIHWNQSLHDSDRPRWDRRREFINAPLGELLNIQW